MKLAAIIVAGLALAATPFASRAEERPPEGRIRARVDVEEVLVDALVVGPKGDPIANLAPADFTALVDGRVVPLTGAAWIPPGQSEAADLPPAAAVETPGPLPSPALVPPAAPRFPEGRLLVFFFQTDFARYRLKGHMEIANEADRLLDGLLPTDRVAVVSFDSHLKLWLDFTSDREQIRKAVFRTIRIGRPPPVARSPFPSLAEHFDDSEAMKAATVERGVALTARALSPIPGAKFLLFFGWGLGVNRSPREGRDFAHALACLLEARVTVFSLDVTHADTHTLEGSLVAFAELTGGTYQKTYYFPAGALDRVLRGTRGRYVLSFARPAGPRGSHRIEITLKGRKGTVQVRPYYED